MTQNEGTPFLQSYLGRIIIMTIMIGTIVGLTFFLGAWYSCKSGKGILSGLSCLNPQIVKVCEYNGKLYLYNQFNKSYSEEKIGLYKELLPNGSLSNETYTRENNTFILIGNNTKG